MESLLQMNKFEVLDMPGMNTLAFLIEKDYDAYAQGYALLSLEMLRSVEVRDNGQVKKVFNVLVDDEEAVNDIVLLTLTDKKAFLSTGILDKDGFRTEETNIPLSYGSIYNIEGIEYKDVKYTPDMKRNFSIIDSQTGEEVKPSLYRDPETGEVKGRCKIMPNRPYIILEVRLQNEI
ncbi:MAG: hypothetical protein IJX34_00080 [Clostridia bacterium]|nr:hypothetical protein [Clostridia bacterium]